MYTAAAVIKQYQLTQQNAGNNESENCNITQKCMQK